MKERIDEGIQAIDLVWSDYTPAAEVAEEAAAIAKEAIMETVGEEGFAPAIITSASDDFHFYTIHRPKLQAAMIGIGADPGPGLHHPDMTFNRDALDIGARVLAATLKKLLIWKTDKREDYPKF
ncbi:M20/M25/M40 family metallo-hydrolase [Sporosarcina limicola]|uniref:Metal-dependent amidase/aminoacylase/carboxypeptidase family protein n=1 Tax=Sporosarcina limicola TaxID=34101 RepID=A0A927R4U6_9BACL|nr:M20/M25/M40 family metallo-hydrolase [Sporosarcina limicola]MBE1556606.1 metal-dependent amidase/aminoacylase/carboxypeptidase family protein [Sporosarcina limicola]